MTRNKKKRFQAFLWHRRAGLAAMALVIILAITGIMLNHTEQLKLDETYVDSALILNWYGFEPAGDPSSYRAGQHTLTAWDHQLFFDNQLVHTSHQTFRGAVVSSDDFIIAAYDTELVLLSDKGELIELMPTGSGFSDIRRIGLKYQRPVIKSSDSLYYMADEHMLDWDVTMNDGIQWSQPMLLDDNMLEKLREAFRGQGLTLERVILDLHSGRIFGSYGNYLMDAAAVALLWLSLSGWWVWWRRRVKQRQKRHYLKHHRA